MWFLFVVITVLAWGGADMVHRIEADPNDSSSQWKTVIMIGLVMGAHALYTLISSGFDFELSAIITYFPVSALYISSMALGYIGFRFLAVSIVSPISNSSGAVAAILCFIFLGQRTTPIQTAAVVVICLSIFAMAIISKKRDDNELKQSGGKVEKKYRIGAMAIIFPILYCVIDGLGTFADAYYLDVVMDETTANTAYELTFFLVAVFFIIYMKVKKKETFNPFKEKLRFCSAMLETIGQYFYVFAMSGNAIVAAPVIASYSIVSVLLSRVFLKEKLSKLEYVFIIAILGGIVVLGFE